MLRLAKQLQELLANILVTAIKECSRNAGVTRTTGTTNAMYVVVNVGGKVIIDNMCNVRDVEATGGDGGGNHDRSATRAEGSEGQFTLALGTVSMDRGSGEVADHEEVGEHIGHALGLYEDESKATLRLGVEDIEQDGTLVGILDILDFLRDILRGRADAADGQEDVVLEEVLGEHLNFAREGGAEHEGLTFLCTRHVFTLNDATNLGLETHVEHAIGLIENEVANVREADPAAFDQVNETTGGSTEDIAAALNDTELGVDVSTTVNDGRLDPGAVGKLASLVMNLTDELTRRCEDQGRGVGAASTAVRVTGLGRGRTRPAGEQSGQDGEQEATGLAGASLSTGHQVTFAGDNRDGVLLDGRRGGVSSIPDVLNQDGIEVGVGEGSNGLRNPSASGFDGDVVILLEVDTCGLLGRVAGVAVQLLLGASVAGADDVLSVPPLAGAVIARLVGLTRGGVAVPTGGVGRSPASAVGVRVRRSAVAKAARAGTRAVAVAAATGREA